MITLRDYQNKGVSELRQSFKNGFNAPVYVLSTGGGKTAVLSAIANGANNNGKVVLILVHRKELLFQISLSLSRVGLRHNIIGQIAHVNKVMRRQMEQFSATFIDASSRVWVASVDTLKSRLGNYPTPDLIICDESHHLVVGNKWGKIVEHYQSKSKKVKILGVTATPVRADGKGLGINSGGFFDDMILGPSMNELISLGFLLKPSVYAPPIIADLSHVKTENGDYNKNSLAIEMDKPSITGDAVKHYAKICPKVPAIAFCVNINHASHVAAEFRANGFDFRVIDGTMDDYKRDQLIDALSKGKIDGLTSCDLISEGVDIPVVGAGILLRPTKSEALYLQQVGRVLRPSPGQTKAYILDHVGNCLIHGLPEADREWTLDGQQKKKRGEKSEPTIKLQQCPQCYHAHEPADTCPQCGHVYENEGRKIAVQEGELTEVTGEVAELLRARQRKEVGRARTLDDLKEIAKQRGYNAKWAEHVYKARMRRSA